MLDEVKANPRKISLGIMGPGQPFDAQVWELQELLGIKFNVVYYASSADIQTDLITGDLDVGLINANRMNFIGNDNFNVLALLGDSSPEDYPVTGKLPFFSDYAEQLGFKWEDTKFLKLNHSDTSIILKAETDPEIIKILEAANKRIHDNPKFWEEMMNAAYPMYGDSATALAHQREQRDALREFKNSSAYEEWVNETQR
jgi:tripartite-type tricarboxylate transporter receptor subunit TctC